MLKLVDDVSHFPSSEAYFPAVYVGVTPTEGMEVEIIHPLKYKHLNESTWTEDPVKRL